MASKTPRKPSANEPIDISTDDSGSDTDFEERLTERACDREEAESAYEKAVEKAQANLEKFQKQAQKEAELDRIARALKKREKDVRKKGKAARRAIGGESSDDTPNPPVSDKTKATDPLNRDQQFAVAANKVAKNVLEKMVADGVTDGPVIDAINALDNEEPPPVATGSHEEQLVLACLPEQLRSGGFSPVDLTFPEFDMTAAVGEPVSEGLVTAFDAMFKGIAVINAKVEQLLRIQQIHTIAHLANIRATGFLRLHCIKDGGKKDKVQANMLIAMKSVILGSDPDLKDLPFRTLATVEVFFRDINHIVKLAHFLLAFVDFDHNYAAKLLDTVFNVQLQRTIFWRSGTANNGCVLCAFAELKSYNEQT